MVHRSSDEKRTPEEKAEIGRLYRDENMSASQILRLRKEKGLALPGETRNAILGVIHRGGYMRTASDIQERAESKRKLDAARKAEARAKAAAKAEETPAQARARKRANNVKVAVAKAIEARERGELEASPAPAWEPQAIPCEDGTGPTLADLPDKGCRFTVGTLTGADQMFCGRPWLGNRGPYCAAHGTPGADGGAFKITPKSPARRVNDTARMIRSLEGGRRSA